MAQRIDVPGMGIVEFPDDMSDANISAAIKRSMAPTQKSVEATAPEDGPGWGEVALDIAKQIPAGIVTGAESRMATFPVIANLLGAGVDYVAPGLFTGNEEQNAKMRELVAANRGGGIAQYLPEAQTPYGKVARSTADFATGGAGIRGGARAGAVAGAASEIAGQATEGTGAEPYARVGAALAGGMLGARSAEKSAAKALPQAKEAGALADDLYAANKAATENVPVSGIHNFVRGSKQLLRQEGVREVNSPKPFEMLDALPGKIKDAYDVVKAREAIRRELNAAGETRAANILTKVFDEAVDNISEKGVGILQAADREYSISKTLEALNKRFSKIEDQTASANSGKNLGNKYRQGLTSLKNSGDIRGLKSDELKQIDRVIQGSTLENALRNYSNRLGGGGGLGQTFLGAGLGGTAYGMGADPQTSAALGLGLGASGAVARAMANRLTARQANKLREMVAARSALAEGLPRRPSVGILGGLSTLPAARGILAPPVLAE